MRYTNMRVYEMHKIKLNKNPSINIKLIAFQNLALIKTSIE